VPRRHAVDLIDDGIEPDYLLVVYLLRIVVVVAFPVTGRVLHYRLTRSDFAAPPQPLNLTLSSLRNAYRALSFHYLGLLDVEDLLEPLPVQLVVSPCHLQLGLVLRNLLESEL